MHPPLSLFGVSLIPKDAGGYSTGFDVGRQTDTDDSGEVLDGDGLNNLAEFELGTASSSEDPNGDGSTDAAEAARGTAPLEPDSD